jgi:hypothetical protein
MRQLIPTVAATLAAVTLATPAAQARPADVGVGSSPQSLPTPAFAPVHRDAGPGRPHWGTGTFGRDSTAAQVQTQTSPLKNQLSIPVDAQPSVVSAPSTDRRFDWTAAAIGAMTALLLALLLAAGLTLRTRKARQLAT